MPVDGQYSSFTNKQEHFFSSVETSLKKEIQTNELCSLIDNPIPNIDPIISKAFHYFFFKNLTQHSSSLPNAIENIKKLNQALTDMFSSKKNISNSTEKTILSYLKMMPQKDPKDLFYMLQKTPFLDTVIEKNNTQLLQFILEQYKNNTRFLESYLNTPRFGRQEDCDNNMRFRFFFESPTFNNLIFKIMPASFFIDRCYPLALSVNAQIHDSSKKELDHKYLTYIKQLSTESERSFFKGLFLSLISDPIPSHKLPDVLPLFDIALNSPHTNYQGIFADFLFSRHHSHSKTEQAPIIETLLSSSLNLTQQKTLFYTLCSTDKGYNTALNAQIKINNNSSKYLLWHLLDEGAVSYTDPPVVSLIERALRQSNNAFIFADKKKLPPINSPIFTAFQNYFCDQPTQALKFLNSFSDIHQDPLLYWDDITQFVSLPAARLKLFSQYHIIHQWAKLGEYEKIQNFFKEHNINPESRDSFWRQKDESGRTPWHFICSRHHKEFLKKMTPSMRRTFIEQLRQQDNTGKNLLDLIYTNTKTAKLVIQLIPELKKYFTDAGYRIDTIRITEKIKPASIIPEPVQNTPSSNATWIIKYIGNDSERKNPDFISQIENEIKNFPPPCSPALRGRQSRERKAQSYTVSAFKMTYSGKAWRVPYITNGDLFYVFPSCERDHAYDDDHCNYIKKLAHQLKQQTTQIRCIAPHNKQSYQKKIVLSQKNKSICDQ